MNTDKIAATARALGISEEQVREVIESADVAGTWITKAQSIITHADGSRHWSSSACRECQA